MMKRLAIISLLFISCAGVMKSQDVHFSQFYLSQLSTDPSLTGLFRGDYRISAVHRNQWRSVSTPYSTFQVTADARDPWKRRGTGIGFRLLNDRAGDSRFNTFSIGTSVSQHILMDVRESLHLNLGLYLGYTQKRIDYSDLRFDMQYDGSFYDAGLDNGELDRGDKASHMDVHAGLSISRRSNSGRDWSYGLSVWNLTTPDVAFMQETSVFLRQRLAIYGQHSLSIDRKWDVVPTARLMLQGPYQEILFGSLIRHTWVYDARHRRRAYLGGFGRWEDAAFLTLGLEHDAWNLGLSYDINLSSLEVASQNRGGLEVHMTYIIDVFNETRVLHRKCMDLL